MKGYPSNTPRQRGIAAVELAIVLPILVALLTVPLYFGLYLMHYSVAQKAAQSAARYMAAVGRTEMRSPEQSANAVAAAKDIAHAMLGDLRAADSLAIDVACDSMNCGAGLPEQIRVDIQLRLRDDLPVLAGLGEAALDVSAGATMHYAGR